MYSQEFLLKLRLFARVHNISFTNDNIPALAAMYLSGMRTTNSRSIIK